MRVQHIVVGAPDKSEALPVTVQNVLAQLISR